jgi:hypothetical protein
VGFASQILGLVNPQATTLTMPRWLKTTDFLSIRLNAESD